jgi:hypothetical protein
MFRRLQEMSCPTASRSRKENDGNIQVDEPVNNQ